MSKGNPSESIRKLDPRTRMLSCKLSKDELLDFGSKLAQVRQDILTEEARQASMKQELKSRLAQLEAQSSEYSSKIARGEEMRDVEVDPRLDFGSDTYYEIRRDTGEKVGERPITDDERQENLGLGKDTKDKKSTTVRKKAPGKKESPGARVN